MQPSNCLQQMLRAPHDVPDPGDGKYIEITKDRQYCSLNPSTTETRGLYAPTQAGLVVHIGCIAAQTVVVTVLDSSGATTGTITFSGTTQWIGLVSAELTAGVFSWQATDVYGCSTTIQTAQNWSAAVANGTMTNLQIATALSVASVLGTNISCASMSVSSNFRAASILATNLSVGTQATIPNILCSSNLSVASVLATNISVGTGLTAPSIVATAAISAASILATNLSIATGLTAGTIIGTNLTAPNITNASKLVMGGSIAITGGTAAVDTQANAVAGPLQLISVGTATNNYFKLPTAALGLCVNVVNLGSTVGIVGHTAGVSIVSATSQALATANATGSAMELVCDGTNWWKRAL